MSWDIHTKLLLKECPEDFVRYFAPGARFVRTRETHFQTRVDSTYQQREMRGDVMFEAEENNEHFLVAPEIQSIGDDKMDERLLGYSYEATRLSGLNVMSAVFYLRPVSHPPQPPLRRTISNGYRSLWFNYRSVEISQKRVAEIRQLNLDGFRPWMVLCQDGARREVVDEVFDYLHSRKRGNLILLTKFYADMVFESLEDKRWLQRRFAMLQEFLWENTSVYRDILELGEEKGLTQGLTQGREEGSVGAARQLITAITQARFPELLVRLKNQVEQVHDMEKLQAISVLVSTAHSVEEIERSLAELVSLSTH